MSFYEQQNSKTEVLEVCTAARVEPRGCSGSPEAPEWTVCSEDPLGGMHGDRQFPCLECIWGGGIASLGTKELVGATALPHSLAQGPRHWLT